MARFLSLLLTGLLSLAGCGATPAAPPPPTRTLPSTSSTTEPTPTPPPIPQAATHNTRRGAIAFVKHYIELANYAQRTGDTEPLKSVEGPHCVSCRRIRFSLSRLYSSGGRLIGGRLSLRGASAAPRPDVGGWTVFGSLRANRQVVVRPGEPSESLPGGSTLASFIVSRADARLVLNDWTRAS